MDIYQRKARVYPAILAMFLPSLALAYLCSEFGFSLLVYEHWENSETIINLVSSSIVGSAIGYFFSESISTFSKWLFQFRLFKEDETKMPTTDLLMYKSTSFSADYIEKIKVRVLNDFGIILPDRNQQACMEWESRKIIANAVQLIRNVTRKDPILLDFNIKYGFFRNLLGGLLISELLLLIIMLTSICFGFNKTVYFVLMLIGLILFIGAFIGMKINSKEYAKQLFSSYIANGPPSH